MVSHTDPATKGDLETSSAAKCCEECQGTRGSVDDQSRELLPCDCPSDGDYSPAIVLLMGTPPMGDDGNYSPAIAPLITAEMIRAGDYSPAIAPLITAEMRSDVLADIVCRCNIWVWCSDPAKCGKQCWLKRAGSADAIQSHGKGEGEISSLK